MADAALSEHLGTKAEVRAFQKDLNLRAEPLFHPQLVEDGSFGALTRQAYWALAWSLGLSQRDVALINISPGILAIFDDPGQRSQIQLNVAKVRRPNLHRHIIGMDGAPLFWGLAKPLVRARERGWEGHVNAGDRRAPTAEKYGKKSQKTLHNCFKATAGGTKPCPPKCGGDCNPANAPGQSSHELRSDGTASFSTQVVGGKLHWWELGVDVENPEALLKHFVKLDYKAHKTYPNTPKERQHINFTQDPGKL
jgi:hypothetical protein